MELRRLVRGQPSWGQLERVVRNIAARYGRESVRVALDRKSVV